MPIGPQGQLRPACEVSSTVHALEIATGTREETYVKLKNMPKGRGVPRPLKLPKHGKKGPRRV